jgi:hypothetical protein
LNNQLIALICHGAILLVVTPQSIVMAIVMGSEFGVFRSASPDGVPLRRTPGSRESKPVELSPNLGPTTMNCGPTLLVVRISLMGLGKIVKRWLTKTRSCTDPICTCPYG